MLLYSDKMVEMSKKVGIEYYDYCMNNKMYPQALVMTKKYGLSEERVREAGIKGYNYYMSNEEYLEALVMAEDAKLGEHYVKKAGRKGYDYYLRNKHYLEALIIAKNAGLGEDKINLAKLLVEGKAIAYLNEITLNGKKIPVLLVYGECEQE